MNTNTDNSYGILKFNQTEIQINTDYFSIGRNNSNDFIISHNSISEVQAIIQLSEDKQYLIIKDNGSLNGTIVNSKKLLYEAIQLNTGDVIRFGNYPIYYAFEYVHLNKFQPRINNAVISNISDRKISLVKSELYQHGNIDHLSVIQVDSINKDKDNSKEKEKENMKEKDIDKEEEEEEDKEKKKKEDKNKEREKEMIDYINHLKETITLLTKENHIFKRKLESKHNSLKQTQKMHSKEELFALNQYQRISNYFNLKDKSQEEALKIVDDLLDNYNSNNHNTQVNQEIINTMQKLFNEEIANFNLIMAKYDKKLSDIMQTFSTTLSSGDENREKAATFLNDQIEQLINEKENLRRIIINQKEHIIMIEIELNLLKTNSSTEIKNLQKQIELLQSNIIHLEHKANVNENKSSKAIEYNQLLINAMNQMKEKEKEIEKLTKQLNHIKSKYNSSSIPSLNLDSKASIKRYDTIELLVNHNNFKVEELKREKDTIVCIQKKV